jgi:hypothetical protein
MDPASLLLFRVAIDNRNKDKCNFFPLLTQLHRLPGSACQLATPQQQQAFSTCCNGSWPASKRLCGADCGQPMLPKTVVCRYLPVTEEATWLLKPMPFALVTMLLKQDLLLWATTPKVLLGQKQVGCISCDNELPHWPGPYSGIHSYSK